MMIISLTMAAQISLASCSAFVRSAPMQVVCMQVVVPLMNGLLLHRHALSFGELSLRFALEMQVRAQAGR